MDSFPSISPSSDEKIAEDPDFLSACLAGAARYHNISERMTGRPLLTRGRSGRLICRMDIFSPDQSDDILLDRIVVHRDDQGRLVVMIAIGQRVDSLEKWAKLHFHETQ